MMLSLKTMNYKTSFIRSKYFIFRLIGAGLEFFDVLGGDVEEGAAEEGEADEEGVGAVGVGANFALEAGEVAADDADGVVDAELGGGELDGAV